VRKKITGIYQIQSKCKPDRIYIGVDERVKKGSESNIGKHKKEAWNKGMSRKEMKEYSKQIRNNN